MNFNNELYEVEDIKTVISLLKDNNLDEEEKLWSILELGNFDLQEEEAERLVIEFYRYGRVKIEGRTYKVA